MILDTNVLIWAATEPGRLTARARAAMESGELIVSAVSAYEIEFKRDRAVVLSRLPADLTEVLDTLGASWLPIEPRHCVAAGRLDRAHRDPWDRIIIAQALSSDEPVVTSDPCFAPFGVNVIW